MIMDILDIVIMDIMDIVIMDIMDIVIMDILDIQVNLRNATLLGEALVPDLRRM